MTVVQRRMGFGLAAALAVNTIVGAGIFRFPGELVGLVGALSWCVYPAVALLLALVVFPLASLSKQFPETGGMVVYTRAAFGAPAGYLMGFSMWMTSALSWALAASALSEMMLGTAGLTARLAAAGLVIALGVANATGGLLGARVSGALAAVKIACLGGFVLLAAVARPGEQPLAPSPLLDSNALRGAVIVGFFALSGFETAATAAGEVKEARTTVGRAMWASLFGAAGLYALIQWGVVAAGAGAHSQTAPLEKAARVFGGATAAMGVRVAAGISLLGLCSAMAFAAPRLLSSMARDGILPRRLSSQAEGEAPPTLSVAASTGVTGALVLSLAFRQLVDFASLILCLQYATACLAAAWIFRAERTTVLVSMAGTVGMAGLLTVFSSAEWTWTAVVMAAGAVPLLRRQSHAR